MFKVRLEKAEPKSVKISKKNVCFITINQSEEEDAGAAEQAKMIEYFMNSREPSWS